MAARKIKNQPASLIGSPIAIYFDSEFGEYQVKIKGKPNATYFTDDKADAFSTAQAMRNEEARIFGLKQNPAPKRKTAARTMKAAVGYVNRPSQITKKAPTKRLKKRRTVNLQVPRGVFPNPKKRDPTYWVITLHNGYLSYRSDSGYTGSEPYSILDGNTERQKAMSFIRKIGIKRGQYEILKDNPDVHFDIDVNSHNARGSKAKTRVNPAARKKEIIVEYELSGHNFAKRNRGMYGWKELAKFPDTPEGSKNAIQYAQAYHKIAPHLRIQVVTK